MKIDERALEAFMNAFVGAELDERIYRTMDQKIVAGLFAYEAARPDPNPWRPIEEVPITPNAPVYPTYVELFNGYHVGIGYALKSEHEDDLLEFWSETAEPIEPKPIKFRTIDPPS